ncbi:hypothetical protein [Azospirillum griseum]|uniref:Homeodomain-like domain-containing protein n=1 Tax=Azospirillum griseum TaxID=2496639 RepID=A0A3S0K5H3_9PROT|nr:hypothetical protein [Azospirillum griseum]RTR21416.1 hypothetical protein EJ903_08365 [Azospirillum griseum]
MPDCLNPTTPATDCFPAWAEEPPVVKGSLVPDSRFHEELWVMAAGMLARGASFQQVARAMGCSRTTLWRAYYGSEALRVRVWWERQSLNREAELRLGSLRALAVEQLERLVSLGDPATVRWVADRLGLFAEPRAVSGIAAETAAAPNPTGNPTRPPAAASADPTPPPSGPPTVQPMESTATESTATESTPTETSPTEAATTEATPSDSASGDTALPAPAPPFPACPDAARSPDSSRLVASIAATGPIPDDDADPGALRERFPPDPEAIAALLARPEAEGPKGVYPWTLNPDDRFPNLGSVAERRGGRGAWSRRT